MSTKKEMDQLLQSFIDGGLPSCGLKVMQRENVIYEGYFGYADMESKKPVTKNSVFRQASMSKLPLYTTFMMLYERGMVDLNDPISKYFPEWEHVKKYEKDSKGNMVAVATNRQITVKDTLTMRCGLPYCNFKGDTDDLTLKSMMECMEPLWNKGQYTLREQIRAISGSVLASEPGEHWLYGFSSELAAGLIEAICDKPIDDVFLELLFKPLGMDDTRSHYFGDIQQRMVTLYALDENKNHVRSNLFDEKHEVGHEEGWGRLFSTVEDYSKLMQMLANGGCYQGQRFMGRKTIDLMRTNCLNKTQLGDFTDSYNAGYGYGYGVRTLIDPAKGNHNGSLGAFGWTGGFGSWCESDPNEGLSIVYMHNLIPNCEQFYHPRLRAVAYGLIE